MNMDLNYRRFVKCLVGGGYLLLSNYLSKQISLSNSRKEQVALTFACYMSRYYFFIYIHEFVCCGRLFGRPSDNVPLIAENPPSGGNPPPPPDDLPNGYPPMFFNPILNGLDPPPQNEHGPPPHNGQGPPPHNGQGPPPHNGQGPPPHNGQGPPPQNEQGPLPQSGYIPPQKGNLPENGHTPLNINPPPDEDPLPDDSAPQRENFRPFQM